MRYDLHLLAAREANPAVASAVLALRLAGDDDPGPLDPETERWKRALAMALQELDPRLELLEADPAVVARLSGISEEEARRRNRDLELAGPEDGFGLQVTLADEGAVVSLRLGLPAGMVVRAWREAWTVLEVLCRIGELAPYDPQLKRPLDLAADIGAVIDRYAALSGKGQAPPSMPAGGEPARGAKGPWWKLW